MAANFREGRSGCGLVLEHDDAAEEQQEAGENVERAPARRHEGRAHGHTDAHDACDNEVCSEDDSEHHECLHGPDEQGGAADESDYSGYAV